MLAEVAHALEQPEHLPLTRLAQLCVQQAELHRKGQPSDLPYARELFRRAICGDEWAWEHLYNQYKGLVCLWILGKSTHVLLDEDKDALVNETFARFARAVTPEKLPQFPAVASLLGYLKRCAHCALYDHSRKARPSAFVPLDEVAEQPDERDAIEATVCRLEATETLRAMLPFLKNQAERVYVYALSQQMTPREVLQAYPDVFSSRDEVYSTQRNLHERFQRKRRDAND